MNTTDPIADMLTRIRNANSAKHKTVDVPNSKMKTAIAEILFKEPGLRVYAGKEELPRVLNGLGTAIISTSKGLKTDKEAREAGMGGEVLAYIW